MGGIIFIIAMLLSLTVMTVIYALRGDQKQLIPLALTMGLAVFNGMVGFVDDFRKLMKKQNEGLKPYQKLFLQIAVAVIYVLMLKLLGYVDTELHIPFTDFTADLGIIYYIFAIFLIVGMVNSVNLTDGIDGLATTVSLIIAIFFALTAFQMLHVSLALASAALIGGMLGFLIFNANPAKVFMGDTGSLYLGGLLTGAAFIINEPMIILVSGAVFVIEALSDIIQVTSFKLRQKRVFKMAPIHHHFEKCGWKENKIVFVFGFATLAFCALAWFGL